MSMLHHHERTCEAKVHFQFPGGACKTSPTIFQLLEDEGFTIPKHLKYFPYKATFEFSVFQTTCKRDDKPVEISQKSSDLMKEEFSFIFEAINQKLQGVKQRFSDPFGDNTLGFNNDDFGTHKDSDDEGEDLMDTDDEDEDIESETEEDREFLDGEEIEEQGVSFYRALDHQHEDKSDDDQENVDEKP